LPRSYKKYNTMSYIKLYRASDDSVVSEDSSNPVAFELRADLNEEDEIRLYAQADSGYQVTDTEVDPTGTTSDKWNLAPDDNGSTGTYGADGAKIELGTVGDAEGTRVHFWAKAKATDDEDPVNDATVTLEVTGIAEAT